MYERHWYLAHWDRRVEDADMQRANGAEINIKWLDRSRRWIFIKEIGGSQLQLFCAALALKSMHGRSEEGRERCDREIRDLAVLAKRIEESILELS